MSRSQDNKHPTETTGLPAVKEPVQAKMGACLQNDLFPQFIPCWREERTRGRVQLHRQCSSGARARVEPCVADSASHHRRQGRGASIGGHREPAPFMLVFRYRKPAPNPFGFILARVLLPLSLSHKRALMIRDQCMRLTLPPLATASMVLRPLSVEHFAVLTAKESSHERTVLTLKKIKKIEQCTRPYKSRTPKSGLAPWRDNARAAGRPQGTKRGVRGVWFLPLGKMRVQVLGESRALMYVSCAKEISDGEISGAH